MPNTLQKRFGFKEITTLSGKSSDWFLFLGAQCSVPRLLEVDHRRPSATKNHSWFCLNINSFDCMSIICFCSNIVLILHVSCFWMRGYVFEWKLKVCSIQLILVKHRFYCEHFQLEYVLPFAICALRPQLNRFPSFICTIFLPLRRKPLF